MMCFANCFRSATLPLARREFFSFRSETFEGFGDGNLGLRVVLVAEVHETHFKGAGGRGLETMVCVYNRG